MKAQFLIGKILNGSFVAVVALVLFGATTVKGTIRTLRDDQLTELYGSCKECERGPYTAIYCGCSASGGSGWHECAVKKVYHTCKSLDEGSCFEGNRYASNL